MKGREISKEEIEKWKQKKEQLIEEKIDEEINEVEQRTSICKRNHKGREEKTENEMKCILKTLFNEYYNTTDVLSTQSQTCRCHILINNIHSSCIFLQKSCLKIPNII